MTKAGTINGVAAPNNKSIYDDAVHGSVEIIQARQPQEIALTRELFREYAAGTGLDLCFQNFEEELSTLPGKYAEPEGRLYLLFEEGEGVACGALRPFGRDLGEMKRLYVRPPFRKRGHGTRLCDQLISAARAIGYRAIVLDTLRSMMEARSLYQKLGFVEIDSYYANPLPDVCYMKLTL